jgi:4-hydroxy-3-polyprenylbenzoate decarboxylase
MEVAVAIGTDPAVTYAATAPMPRGVDELLLAGFIRQEPVRMVKALTVDIRVPAKAEFILEGYIDPEETRIEGPFGDHTGYYSLEGEYPVFHVTALTHRRNPVYSTTIVGRPPMEDCYLAYATERIFLPLLRTILPEIEDYTLPWEGVFHNIVVAVLDKEFPGHAAKVMSGLWGTGQMSFAKAVVLIDDKSLLSRREDLLRHILDTIDFQSDILLTEGILDVLDHSAPQGLYGTKIGIDATSRIAGETARPARPTSFETLSEFSIRARLQEIAPGVTSLRVLFPNTPRPLMILAVKKEGERNSKYYLDLLQKDPLFRGILVIYDSDIDLANDSLLLWKAFNNVDPGRDIRIVRWGAMLDATRKGPQDGHHREWPDDIVMSENIVQLVNEKFPEIGKK